MLVTLAPPASAEDKAPLLQVTMVGAVGAVCTPGRSVPSIRIGRLIPLRAHAVIGMVKLSPSLIVQVFALQFPSKSVNSKSISVVQLPPKNTRCEWSFRWALT